LLGLTMGRYGTGVGLLASYLAGVIGNVLVCLLCSGPRRSLGASGLVMGCLGLIAVQSFTPQVRSAAQVKRWLGGAAGGVLLFILLGVAPDTDIVAHGGGFLGGIGVGLMCARVPGLPRMAAVNFFCASLFALLVLLPWWLALRSAVGP
jgi:membrane associated rhomboid family serine protease